MADLKLCKICGKRRAKRACPAVGDDICSICCGTEREVSLFCPLECPYLREAHRREKPVPVLEKDISHPEIRVDQELVRRQEELVVFCAYSLLQAALHAHGAIDSDALAALEALIQTHRTLESGLFYETRPENAVAHAIQRGFAASLADYEKMRQEREALSPLRNADVLAVLVFLHRIGQQNQNGRPKGRMFLDLLRQMTPEESVREAPSSIIL